MQWNPNLSNLQGKEKLAWKSGSSRNRGGGGGIFNEGREAMLIRVYRGFQKLRVHEIGIPLYMFFYMFPQGSAGFVEGLNMIEMLVFI